jgi:hypothetical protein
VVVELLPVLSPEKLDVEELKVEGEQSLPLRLLSDEEEEEDSLQWRLRAFFEFFDFLGLLRDLDDCVDAALFALVPVVPVPILALADPFSSCVTPSASLESVKIKGLAPTLVLATALMAAAADAAAAGPGPGPQTPFLVVEQLLVGLIVVGRPVGRGVGRHELLSLLKAPLPVLLGLLGCHARIKERKEASKFDVERARNNLQVRKLTPAATAAATAATAATAEY